MAMDVLLPAARCGIATQPAGAHFQRLLSGMLADCSAREVFSATMEVVQCMAR